MLKHISRLAKRCQQALGGKPATGLARHPAERLGLNEADISPAARKVLARLQQQGFQACLVGGGVRDLLLGRHPKDFDVATDARPEEVREIFRNSRIIGRRFKLVHVRFGREIIEVATFRGSTDNGKGDRHLQEGRLIRDNVYGSIEDDALRRDFTVNALYYDYASKEVLDFANGLEDLKQRRLCLIGEAEKRYREDPVRMLRAVRFAAKLGLKMDDSVCKPIPAMAELLADIAPARLFDEMLKLFMAGHAETTWKMLVEHGLFQQLFPQTWASMQQRQRQDLLLQALRNTDERIRIGKPVTPGFLAAALLWYPYEDAVQKLQEAGSKPHEAMHEAAEQVITRQIRRVAIPRRFTTMTREIWLLQPRFRHHTGKRAWRLLEHPRFRAAYDFLLLRGLEDEACAREADWWTETQQLEGGALKKRLSPPRKRRKPRAPASGNNG